MRDGGRALVALLERIGRGSATRCAIARSSDRYYAILDLLERPAPLRETAVTLKAIQAAEHARLAKAIAKLDRDTADEELHRVRIKAKRARYAAELAGTMPT